MKLLLSLLFLGTIIFAKELNIEKIFEINVPGWFEPSGVTYSDGDIFVIDDNGYLLIERDIKKRILLGNFKEKSKIYEIQKDKDLEGATFGNGKLYIVKEGKDRILEIGGDIRIKDEYKVEREYLGEKITTKKGNGLEGIVFYKSDNGTPYFFVANQSDHLTGIDRSVIMLVKLKRKKAVIQNVFNMPITDISGMTFKKDYLYIISDNNDMLYIYHVNKDNLEFKMRYKLPGKDQEGIALDDEDNIIIADDSGKILYLFLNKQSK